MRQGKMEEVKIRKGQDEVEEWDMKEKVEKEVRREERNEGDGR